MTIHLSFLTPTPQPESEKTDQGLSRRTWLKGLGAASGLALAVTLDPFKVAHAYTTGAATMGQGVASDPHLFVSIAPSGDVTINYFRSEMGQGTWSTLPLIIADEMDADWNRVTIVQGDGDSHFGNQDTDGSRTVRQLLPAMRRCGAMMRTMLKQAASDKWGVPFAEISTGLHEVVHEKSKQKAGFGELAEAAMAMPVPDVAMVDLKEASKLRYMGKDNQVPRNHRDITTGALIYGYDVRVPDMKYAAIARPPVVGGKVKSFDDTEAKKIPGVLQVFKMPVEWTPATKWIPLGGVAVVATNTWAAMQGKNALKIEWEAGPNGSYNSDTYKAALKESAAKPDLIARAQGDAGKAIGASKNVLKAEYYVPHTEHATMEPLSATVDYRDGKAEIWAPAQYLFDARVDAAKIIGLPLDKVTLHGTFLGGGFGRKGQHDFVQEAALVAKTVGGPVKLSWTREDTTQHGFYSSATYQTLEASIGDGGKVEAWRHREAGASLMANFIPNNDHLGAIEMSMGAIDLPFDIPNVAVEVGKAKTMTRVAWFRSVHNVPHAFAIQSFVAELAHHLNKDPKEFLLEIIGPDRKIDITKIGLKMPYWGYTDPYETYPIDTARLKNVVNVAANAAGWGRKLPKGTGLGIAAHHSFLSDVATVVEVSVDSKGKLSIGHVHTAVDCGFAVNPDRIRSQSEGAAVQGTGIARFAEITFKDGACVQANFDTYRLPRFEESPLKVTTHIVEHGPDVPAAGVGEPAVPPIAPALINAIFAATGRRIRTLPIGDQDLTPI